VMFTGAVTPISVTVARKLGNEGALIVFAGDNVASEEALQPLLIQFRQDIVCVDARMDSTEAVQDVVAGVELACGPVELLFHTLGGARPYAPIDAFSSMTGSDLAMLGSAPLLSALTCSSAAIRHMSHTSKGHVIHLIARADVGAVEVEEIVLNRLKNHIRAEGYGSSVQMSAIYFENVASLQLPGTAPVIDDEKVLYDCAARLTEEDGWISRVMLEQAIGDMVKQVCNLDTSRTSWSNRAVQQIDFMGGARPNIQQHSHYLAA
jgi:NADP-dependent 3-hydroxy acid dehydrogenase YdfG